MIDHWLRHLAGLRCAGDRGQTRTLSARLERLSSSRRPSPDVVALDVVVVGIVLVAPDVVALGVVISARGRILLGHGVPSLPIPGLPE